MRDRVGKACQLVGLILMPIAVLQGINEAWSFGTEIVVGSVGFLLIFVGRGLRGGPPPK